MHMIPQAFNPPGEPIDRELPPPFVKIMVVLYTYCMSRRNFLDGRHLRVR
jgi:hypothetical protein